jgi:adenine-specific DNA-methyltransferase
MGKEYDTSPRIDEFVGLIQAIMHETLRVTVRGGNICWQVGYHVKHNAILPLDYIIYDAVRHFSDLRLRNRIVWTFGHGHHPSRRFSGRHENVLWFSKGDMYFFDLDSVRVRQKYPGKLHYKGPKKGQPSGNPKGKNPSDVWEIPNVKANHIEKTEHPCQFPVGLARRLISALSPQNGLVIDPFMGSGSTAVAALSLGRRFAGAETNRKFWKISAQRVRGLRSGATIFRPEDVPVFRPRDNARLTILPSAWCNGSIANGVKKRN